MKNKIVVVHHSNQLGLGGTEKDMYLFCKYLDKDIFDVHALARKHPVPRHRVLFDQLKSGLGNKNAKARCLQYAFNNVRVPDFIKLLGEDHVHFYSLSHLSHFIKKLSPQILHVHHNGLTQPPLDQAKAMDLIPLIFTINGFGFKGDSPHHEKISRILFPSDWVWNQAAPWSKGDARCGMLYCPIEKPYSQENLRAELNIPNDIFVLGRVGRNADDIHDPISLRAYQKIENEKTLFLGLAPPPIMKRQARELGIRNIRYLEPTVDEVFLSKFYNTLDVLAHARLDGETFGCVVAEAMIHRRTVITHISHIRNAQVELVGSDSGFVTKQNDFETYSQYLKTLMQNPDLKLKMAAAAEKRALENFEAEFITKKLEKMYFEELKNKKLV